MGLLAIVEGRHLVVFRLRNLQRLEKKTVKVMKLAKRPQNSTNFHVVP